MNHRRAGPLLAILSLTAACKRQPETVTETVTVTHTVTNTVTETNTVTRTDPDLDPGRYSAPIVWVQSLIDNAGVVGTGGAGENHMHLSEMVYREAIPDTDGVDATSNAAPPMLIQCSYYFGFYNAKNPGNMSVMAQGFRHATTTGTKEPGCIHLALDDEDRELVFTTHHGGITDGLGFLSGWDLNLVNSTTDADLDGIVDGPDTVSTAPTEIPKLTEPGFAYEGLDVEDGILWVTLHKDGLGAYTYDTVTQTFTRLSLYKGTLENSWDVRVEGDLAYVADGIGGLVTLDVSDPLNPVELDRAVFGGQARDIMVNGDVVYVAAESGGIAVVDAADPANLMYVQSMNVGSGGAIALDYDDGKLFVGAWNDARVYDTTVDPYYPTVIGAIRHTVAKEYTIESDVPRPDITDRVLAVAGNDNFLFNGTWWVPNNYEIFPDNQAPYIDLPQNIAQMTFPGDLNAGESSTFDLLVQNGGTADLSVVDVWTTNPSFTPSTTEMVIPPGGAETLTVTFTADIGVDGATTDLPAYENGLLNIVSDDPTQPIRQGFLEGNVEGLSIGDPFPETLATLTDGSEWSFTQDALGSVTLVAYFATF